MTDHKPELDPLKEDPRVTSLNERLARAKSQEADRQGEGRRKDNENYRLGNRILAELIGGMVGGGVIGWTLDWLLGTSPWFLLSLLALGIISGFRNIIRISNQRSE